MKKKFKFILIGIIGIFSLTTLMIVNFNLKQSPTTFETVFNLDLYVNYNNGTIKVRQNFTLTGGKTTAFDALNKWCIIKYDDYGWGIIVREIDGISGNWLYFINEYSPSVGSNLYPLENGDIVKWERV